jgi:hypothetical protein
MTTFCNECGCYQGHEPTCSQSEQVTIDDLSMENSLIRARNERLEACRTETVKLLTHIRDVLTASEWRDMPIAVIQLDVVISKLTGSAT